MSEPSATGSMCKATLTAAIGQPVEVIQSQGEGGRSGERRTHVTQISGGGIAPLAPGSASRAKGIGIMCPVVPATQENARDMIAKGVNMLILGNDMYHLQSAFKNIMADCVAPIRQG